MPFPADGIQLFFMQIYGGFGYDGSAAASAYLGLASGIPQAGNPPYTLFDFLAMHPQFFGPATSLAGTVTTGSNQVTGIQSTAGLQPGQLAGRQFPTGTILTSVSTSWLICVVLTIPLMVTAFGKGRALLRFRIFCRSRITGACACVCLRRTMTCRYCLR